ncbi:MAG: hypothetical protein FI703_06365 [SAR202 cluster bacterium]|nr:hypothetical protein [SAR202 cluster bacterium]
MSRFSTGQRVMTKGPNDDTTLREEQYDKPGTITLVIDSGVSNDPATGRAQSSLEPLYTILFDNGFIEQIWERNLIED